ncbi:MAG: hypothetical protein JW736_04310, partial [Deltaproteobacteria bacterium]|nr:hypothetical protein [Deltaproteobacteria bacterium]
YYYGMITGSTNKSQRLTAATGRCGQAVMLPERSCTFIKVFKFLNDETCISDNTRHRKGMYGICSWYGDDSLSIGHGDVFSLSCNPFQML